MRIYHLPTHKPYLPLHSVSLSNLNQFSKFYTAGKRMKFTTRNLHGFPPHLHYVATLPREVKSPNLLKITKDTTQK